MTLSGINILEVEKRKSRQKSENKAIPQYGEDIDTQINVSIKEAFFGVNKKIKLRTVDGKETSFSVKVPAGVQSNDRLRIVGQGKKGKNGGKNGDLLVRVNISDDKKFRLIGTKKKMELFGEEINIVIPKCCNSGEKLIIKEKGYKDGKGKRGNLNIITKIVFPKELSKEQEKLYIKLKEI